MKFIISTPKFHPTAALVIFFILMANAVATINTKEKASTITTDTIHPYIVFLDLSSPLPTYDKHSTKTNGLLFDIPSNNTNTVGKTNSNHPEIFSIGSFRWYVDVMNEHEASRLASLDHISRIHKDKSVFNIATIEELEQQHQRIQTDLPSWGIDRIDQRKGIDDQFHFPDTAGEGVDIYLIDTGVNVEHDDFEGRARHGPSFTPNQDPDDTNGHGSFVAGVCCGKVHGVAKKANIISVKALEQSGSGKLSNILLGLHWVVQRHVANPKAKTIVNLSLASEFHLPTNQAIEQAIELGIHFSIAAGNQGKDACEFSPSSIKSALVVGAINPDDSIASYSNFGSCVNIYAPGTAITSAWNGNRSDIHYLSGTSMAAPHVAGVMAVLLSQQDYSPAELLTRLKESATVSRSATAKMIEEDSYVIKEQMNTSMIRILYMDANAENFVRTDIVDNGEPDEVKSNGAVVVVVGSGSSLPRNSWIAIVLFASMLCVF